MSIYQDWNLNQFTGKKTENVWKYGDDEFDSDDEDTGSFANFFIEKNLPIIIGIAVGGLFSILFPCILIICIIQCRKRKRKRKQSQEAGLFWQIHSPSCQA